MWIACGAANLALQFAVACRIDVRKRRTCVRECLRVRDASRGAENAEKLVALAADASEHPQLLQNHGPGNDGKEKKQEKNAAGDQAGLRKNISEIRGKNGCEQKNDVPLSEK
jgi:hypothetical protein